MYKAKLREKSRESLQAVLPIVISVLLLSLTAVPVSSGIIMSFLISGIALVGGMMLFSLGAETFIAPMGEQIGARLVLTKKLRLILLLGFFMGLVITVSEPDLRVLAGQIPSVPNTVLIFAVALGVGVFLIIALLRMLFSIPLKIMLAVSYAAVFILLFFVPESFYAIAFDSGGVTTGPMTVPFIMAFGLGISAIRSDRSAAEDSFGLIALCSVGPIAAVLILGLIYKGDIAGSDIVSRPELSTSTELGKFMLGSIPEHIVSIAVSMLPIIAVLLIFQLVFRSYDRRSFLKSLVGAVYTYVGLVLFLTDANVGFLPAGYSLGGTLANMPWKYMIIPVGMVLGFFIVSAEPAVYVLMRQVEEITDGAISGVSLKLSLSVGTAVSVGLAMLRILTGISAVWFLVPGYAAALIMSVFTPKIFTAIAFDSGGVASGPMTATFLLPFATGVCAALGGDVVRDAFGVVAMVAMTPLIAIQVLGLIYKARSARAGSNGVCPDDAFAEYGEFDVIEL